MSPPKVLSGARAKVSIYDPNKNISIPCGMFMDVSYGFVYHAEPAYILGSYSAVEIDYTALEVVQITCSGWRTFGHDAHAEPSLPRLDQLLLHEYLDMVIEDRQRIKLGLDPRVAKIRKMRPVSFSGGFSQRQLSSLSITYLALLTDSETQSNNEDSTAAILL